nr:MULTISPECIES: FAD:protein FMN transferase [Gracilibacillus]
MWRQTWILGIISMLIMAGCSNGTSQADDQRSLTDKPYEETEFLLGTVVTVKIYDEEKEAVLDKTFDRVRELEDKITMNEDGSEVNEINQQAGKQPVPVSDDVYSVIEAGKNYSELADGSFDITIGPITGLWNIGMDNARKPTEEEIDQVLPLVHYEQVALDQADQSVLLQEANMLLDLGAIAKGYIADEIVQLLEEQGVTTAIIDLGGNIYVLGDQPSGGQWTVGIQNPFMDRGETVGKLMTVNQSIVTSGIYERYLEVDGQRYHHLLDPKTGYPFDGELASVSIISDDSIDGDALSTILFSKGLQAGMEFIEEFEGVEAIFITKDKEVYTTEGLVDQFELTNEAFSLE